METNARGVGKNTMASSNRRLLHGHLNVNLVDLGGLFDHAHALGDVLQANWPW